MPGFVQPGSNDCAAVKVFASQSGAAGTSRRKPVLERRVPSGRGLGEGEGPGIGEGQGRLLRLLLLPSDQSCSLVSGECRS